MKVLYRRWGDASSGLDGLGQALSRCLMVCHRLRLGTTPRMRVDIMLIIRRKVDAPRTSGTPTIPVRTRIAKALGLTGTVLDPPTTVTGSGSGRKFPKADRTASARFSPSQDFLPNKRDRKLDSGCFPLSRRFSRRNALRASRLSGFRSSASRYHFVASATLSSLR